MRATNQTVQEQSRVYGNRHRSGIRGTESRPPSRNVRGDPRRATVTPALANTGQLHV